jgi:Fur family transcriptional regulator, iron response regulator
MTDLPQSVYDQLAIRSQYGNVPVAIGTSRIFDAGQLLESANLRPTRPRLALVEILFGDGGRHLTAEMLYEEASACKVRVSLATVYNTLNCLARAGLLRQVHVDGSKTYFDTNVSGHQHFYSEDSHELIDIPDSAAIVSELPNVPGGYEICRIEIIVRIRKRCRSKS